MAHQLTIRADQTAEMAFAGEGCWHGLGQKLERGASIEEWRKAAGMDWRIQRSKVRYCAPATDNPGAVLVTHIDEDNHVLFRSDSKDSLGIVSRKFKVVQPAEVLEFFRDLTAGQGFDLETAGTLFGGRRFWALARIGEDAVIRGVDRVGGYLLLVTACDGSLATTGRFTTVRVVCNNTLSMALSKKDKGEVRITHRSEFDADAMKARLGVGAGQFQRFIAAATDLSKARITPVDAQELTVRLLAGAALDKAKGSAKETAEVIEKTVASKGFRTIQALFEGQGLGSDLATARGTAWGWVNAVTQYTDYAAPARSQDNRMNNALFGSGDEFKTEALEMALAL